MVKVVMLSTCTNEQEWKCKMREVINLKIFLWLMLN